MATELPLHSQVRRGKKHQVCFPSLRGFSRPARSDGMPARRKPEGCRIFESGLAAGSQLWQPQESGCRNLGLCFRNITWKVSGAAARRSETPHLIYGRRRGQGRGADRTVPPGSGWPRAPGCLAGGPIPFRPGHCTAPCRLRVPRAPACASSGAGRWATVAVAAHRNWAGFFFSLFLPTFSSSACRALPAIELCH